jgi:Carboxypeptidase regulatory-like domain
MRSNTTLPFLFIFSCILFSFSSVYAQNPQQTLRGQVFDAVAQKALAGATVLLEGSTSGTSTDENGKFRFENLPVGRYRLRISFVGYDTLVVPEVLLEAGRETVLQLPLNIAYTTLSELSITAAPLEIESLNPSVRSISNETTLRFPGVFFDPARTASAFPGVVNTNDQANFLSVRGNTPNANLWRLEGVDILNPNHTPNAGSQSDLPTFTGGGVNMLSTQMLGNSAFLSGDYAAGYGNALGGIFDMRLRTGNNEQQEYTLQASLLGLDVAAEGPIGKAGGASYLVNARYSTLGLLSDLGLDLGGEAIGFKDLAINLVFPFAKGGKFTVFGMAGNSSNVFTGDRDSTTWEFDKDRQDIDFESSTQVLGGTFRLPTGKKGMWHTAFAYSSYKSARLSTYFTGAGPTLGDQIGQSRRSLNTYWYIKTNPRQTFKAGVIYNGGELIQPYTSTKYDFGNLELELGLHYIKLINANGLKDGATSNLEPRLNMAYRLDGNKKLTLSLGSFSQKPILPPYDSGTPIALVKSVQSSIGLQIQTSPSTSVEIQAYYQKQTNVVVLPNSFQTLSSNFSNERVPVLLSNLNSEEYLNADGEARNYGLELNLRRYLEKGFYLLANTSIYQSEYRNNSIDYSQLFGNNDWRDSHFNGRYVFNTTAGKEWRKERKAGKVKLWGLNGRVVVMGNLRQTPIDATLSQREGITVPLFFTVDGNERVDAAFSVKSSTYFRLDTRLYFKWNTAGRNNTFALDIQNASNQENAGFFYYDHLQKQVLEKKQLGIIPILSYRVEF